MNVQPLNVPVPVAVHALGVPIVPLPLIVNVIVTPGVNPLPDAVTVTPLGPCAGTSVIIGGSIVNDAVAVSLPPSDPVAVTVYGVPDAGPVMVTVQLNVPPVTVAPHPEMAAPALMVAVIVVPLVNPVPTMVTGVPAWPWLGHAIMEGEVTLDTNGMLVEPASPPASVTVSPTV